MNLRHRLVVLVLLWLAGLYLRAPVLLAPPLAPYIDGDLGLNQTLIGALTTIPVLMLSLGALPGAIAIARLGPLVALVCSILIVGLASMGRALAPPVWLLFVNTTLLGLAIAVMQPALPALVLRWCPGFVALGSAVYMNGMLMSEFLAGGLTLPLLMPLIGDDWRLALVVCSLPAFPIASLVYFSRYLGVRQQVVEATGPRPWKPPLKDPGTWRLGTILGAASASFFGANAYFSSLLDAKGELDQLATYLFVFNGTQLLGSVSMLLLAGYLVGRREPVIAMAWCVLLGLVGVVLGEGLVALAALVVLGLATCTQLILIVAMVPQIATERDAAPLAAGMFMVGYLLGFVVPLAGGLGADLTSDPRVTFVPLMLLAAIGIFLAHRMVD
ncbi:MAG: MFS transporter [Proteobacteria bacterium]|nr:MFS transporter [Pseudomonadota bacterium]